jgi:predicted transcriptional regulator
MDTEPSEQHELKITIRLPAKIAEKMRRLAKAHDRSLNGEIVRALRVYGESQDPQGESQP